MRTPSPWVGRVAVMLKVLQACTVLAAIVMVLVFPAVVAIWGHQIYSVGVEVGLRLAPSDFSITHPSFGDAHLGDHTGNLMVYPDVGLAIAFGVIVLPYLGLMFFMLHQLRRLLDPIREGTPFTLDSMHCIRRVAIALVVCECLTAISRFALSRYCVETFNSSGISLSAVSSFDFTWLLVAMFLYAFAEVFRYGVKLERERGLTI